MGYPSGFVPNLRHFQGVSRRPRVVCSYSQELLVQSSSMVSSSPKEALEEGSWVKLICGASMDDVPFVQKLAEVFTLGGVDCIDCAADSGVVSAVLRGISDANRVLHTNGIPERKPFLMVSINDGEDPHFRKATFDPSRCPSDCPRPCEPVCPTDAISTVGVETKLCYGCGRCILSCPFDLIDAHSYVRSPSAVVEMLRDYPIDAIEIHTLPGHGQQFQQLWEAIGSWIQTELKLLAVSFPDSPAVEKDIERMSDVIGPLPSSLEMVWQTDGQPMSGDVGRGKAHASVRLAGKVYRILQERNLPGHVQLAGGTNDATADLLGRNDLFKRVSGVAFGGFARKATTIALQESDDHALQAALDLIMGIKKPAKLMV